MNVAMKALTILLIASVTGFGFTATGFAAAATVKAGTAAIDGASKQVLTNDQGMTLYYFTSDTPTKSACTGGCGSIWPAFLSDSAPTASMLPGKLSVVKTDNGSQVAYNGHLLYMYSRDQAPGDTKGQGIAGKWFAATTDLKAAAPAYCCTMTNYGNGSGGEGGSGGGNGGGMEGGHGGY